MTTPSIPHASTCTDPRSSLRYERVLWESAVGKMYERCYRCVTCGERVQIERFEAFEVEEED